MMRRSIAWLALLAAGPLLIPGPVLAAPTGVPINGDFSRLDAGGSPAGWVGISSAGAKPAEAGVELVPGAYEGHNAVRLYSHGSTAAILNQAGPQPVLRGSVSLWYRAVSSAVKGANLAFYVIPFTGAGSEGGAARTAWNMPAAHVGDGQWHHAVFSYDYAPDLAVTGVELDPRVNETAAVGAGEWLLSDIRLTRLPYSTGPRLAVRAFSASVDPLRAGEPWNLALTVANQGRQPAAGLHLSLSLAPGISARPAGPAVTSLAPNHSQTFLWHCADPARIGRAWARVRLSSSNAGPVVSRWDSVILAAGNWSRMPGALTIQTSVLRLSFPPVPDAGRRVYPVCSVERRTGSGWRTVIILPHLAQVITAADAESAPAFPRLLTRTPRSIQFEIPNPRWHSVVRFDLPNGTDTTDTIDVSASLHASGPVDLLAFRCPDLRIGEGTFGATKHDAVFPGLEFLASNQRSSSSEFIVPPDSERWTPHPLRITMPVMSIAAGGLVTTLTWNANARWDGQHQGLSAQFASPNRPMMQNNTRMALFVPTIPQWVDENGIQASRPYPLQAGRAVHLDARVIVAPGRSALDGVKTVENRWGREWPIARPPRTLQQEITLCAHTFQAVLWKGPQAGWEPVVSWKPGPDPGITLQLLKLAARTTDARLAARLRQQAAAVIQATHNNRSSVDLALWTGDTLPALADARRRAQAEMKSQRPDGTWGFEPDTPDRAKLGPRGATNVGVCSTHLGPIAAYALMTRDPAAVRSLLKALHAMEQFQIPAGAQVWECPLGEPDIYAAAVAIPPPLAAYQITGDRKYLERAIHWAWTGVPFVYQWRAADRPIMDGGSIAVFGSTGFTWSWMGRPVQWNGLAYADSLLRLASSDPSFDWQRLALSITDCGMQEQQTTDPNTLGCYPDSFHLLSNQPAGPWLSPSAILSNLFRLREGSFAYPNTIATGSRRARWLITSGAPCTGRTADGDLLVDVSPRPGITSRLLISAPRKPSGVLLNGRALVRITAAQKTTDGWEWDADDGVALVRVANRAPFHLRVSTR